MPECRLHPNTILVSQEQLKDLKVALSEAETENERVGHLEDELAAQQEALQRHFEESLESHPFSQLD